MSKAGRVVVGTGSILRESEELWRPAAEETKASPQLAFQNGLPALPVHPAPGPDISHAARCVIGMRAKDHRRSQAPQSQTARHPAGVYLSVTDYISPVSCLYESVYQHRSVVGPATCQVTGGQWPDSAVAAVGRELSLFCLLFLQEPKFRLVKW